MVRTINKIIIHCTDSPDDRDLGYAEINGWHKLRWDGVDVDGVRIYCGYHFIIRRDGSVEPGRPEYLAGAHCVGHNWDSIGVVWVGKEMTTAAQYTSLISTCVSIMGRYGLEPAAIYGHRQFNPGKTCPNLDVKKLIEAVEREINFI